MVLISSYFRPDQVKIQGQNEEMLLAACEQFLSKSDDEIQQVNNLDFDVGGDDQQGWIW